MSRPGPSLWFSLVALGGSLAVAIASAAKGRWAVAIVFGLLAVGFLVRAGENRRRGRGRDGEGRSRGL